MNPPSDGTTPSWDVTLNVGAYQWTVQAKTDTGSLGPGSTHSLTVYDETIRNRSPSSGYVTYNTPLETLGWDDVTGATGYDVRIKPSPQGQESEAIYSVDSSSYTLESDWALDGYAWEVRAKVGTVTGAWSNSRTLTLADDTISGMSPGSPQGGTAVVTYNKKPTLSWDSVDSAAAYNVEITPSPQGQGQPSVFWGDS